MHGDIERVKQYYWQNKEDYFVKQGLKYFFDSPVKWLNEKRLEAILECAGNVSNKNILDLCCGTGLVSILLSMRGGNVWGIDADKTSIEIAQKLKNKLNEPKVAFFNDDILKLNIPHNSQDIIILAYALHHIQDQLKAINMIRKWLKMDGILILNEENRYAPVFKIKHFVRFKILRRDIVRESHLSYNQLRTMLGERGFELVEEQAFDYVLLPNRFKWCLLLKAKKKGESP